MGKEALTFADTEIKKKKKKSKFYLHKATNFLKDVDIEKVPTRFLLAKRNYKYFIGYLHNNYKVKPLHRMLPKTRAYVKRYSGQTKLLYFLIQDDDLLERSNTI